MEISPGGINPPCFHIPDNLLHKAGFDEITTNSFCLARQCRVGDIVKYYKAQIDLYNYILTDFQI